MNTVAFAALIALTGPLHWSPPPDPDPHAILESAESVARQLAFSTLFFPTNVTDDEKADATAPLIWFTTMRWRSTRRSPEFGRVLRCKLGPNPEMRNHPHAINLSSVCAREAAIATLFGTQRASTTT